MKIQRTLTEIWGIAKERQRERKGARSVLTFIDGISALTCKPHAKNLIAAQLNIYIALYHFQSFLVSIVQANFTVSCD